MDGCTRNVFEYISNLVSRVDDLYHFLHQMSTSYDWLLSVGMHFHLVLNTKWLPFTFSYPMYSYYYESSISITWSEIR